MKVDPTPALQNAMSRGVSSISFTSGDDFAAKLTLGQIIKGRVLRSYEGSRYLVDFNGQQKVVDSAVPLRVDEVIYGRVIGLTERVELQRVNASVDAAAAPGAPEGAVGALAGKSGQLISALLERFQVKLPPAELGVLRRAVERATQPQRMALAGIALAKLGIPVSGAALRAVFEALRSDPRAAMFALPGHAIHLGTRPAGADAVAPATAAFSALLREMLGDVPELQHDNRRAGDRMAAPAADRRPGGRGRQPARDGAGRDEAPDIARLILNVQPGGAVAHRVGTLPMFVDGRLVELNIAVFEQNGDRNGAKDAPLQHRQVVFAVTTETLGRVEVHAAIAGRHMRVKVSAESSESAQFLSRHAGRLAADLEVLGWTIDELAYQTVGSAAPGTVGQAVLEHLIAPGSVSALA